jgi:hypothetical protein
MAMMPTTMMEKEMGKEEEKARAHRPDGRPSLG